MRNIISDYERAMKARAEAREADRERHKQARRRFERSLLPSVYREQEAYRLMTRDEFLDN